MTRQELHRLHHGTQVFLEGGGTGYIESSKMDDNFWIIALDDGDHGPTYKTFHINYFEIMEKD